MTRVKEERLDIRELNKRFMFPLVKVLEYVGSPCDYSFDVEDFEQFLLAGGCFAYFRAKVPGVTSEDALVTAVMESWQGDRHFFPEDYSEIHRLSAALGDQGKRIGGMGFLVTGPEESLRYSTIQRVYDRLQALMPTKLKFRGIVPDNALGGVCVTTMFSGLPVPAERLKVYREYTSQRKEAAVTTDMDLLAGLGRDAFLDAYSLKPAKPEAPAGVSFGFEDLAPKRENGRKEELFNGVGGDPKRKPASRWNI